MSYAGLSTSQLTPELLQQMQQNQQQQKQQAMAQALMGNKANPTTPYAGVANAGGDILGALASNHIQQNAMQQAQNNATPQTAADLGQLGTLNARAPNLPTQPSWLSGMFGMGGS